MTTDAIRAAAVDAPLAHLIPDADRDEVDEYLQAVAARRGPEAGEQLRRDCAEQWTRGSRGAPGEWRTTR